jgi:hypothetical protein
MSPHVYAESLEEFRGFYSSLQETHHPFDVLPLESVVELGHDVLLRRYVLIILPDLGPLGPGPASALDAFVDHGGHVLSTGTSGVGEDGGLELTASPALMRLGAPMAGEALWSTYVTVDEQPHIDDYHYAPSVIPVFGSASRFVWNPTARKLGFVMPQAPFGPPGRCYGHTGSEDPAMVSRRHGAGKMTMVPWTIGRTYREFGTAEVRAQVLRAVEPLGTVAITASMPEQVELILGRDDEGYVLHLINMSGARHRSFGPHVTIHGGRLRLHDMVEAARAEALVAGEVLPLRADGSDVVLDLPPLELFEVVRVCGPVPDNTVAASARAA